MIKKEKKERKESKRIYSQCKYSYFLSDYGGLTNLLCKHPDKKTKAESNTLGTTIALHYCTGDSCDKFEDEIKKEEKTFKFEDGFICMDNMVLSVYDIVDILNETHTERELFYDALKIIEKKKDLYAEKKMHSAVAEVRFDTLRTLLKEIEKIGEIDDI